MYNIPYLIDYYMYMYMYMLTLMDEVRGIYCSSVNMLK